MIQAPLRAYINEVYIYLASEAPSSPWICVSVCVFLLVRVALERNKSYFLSECFVLWGRSHSYYLYYPWRTWVLLFFADCLGGLRPSVRPAFGKRGEKCGFQKSWRRTNGFGITRRTLLSWYGRKVLCQSLNFFSISPGLFSGWICCSVGSS